MNILLYKLFIWKIYYALKFIVALTGAEVDMSLLIYEIYIYMLWQHLQAWARRFLFVAKSDYTVSISGVNINTLYYHLSSETFCSTVISLDTETCLYKVLCKMIQPPHVFKYSESYCQTNLHEYVLCKIFWLACYYGKSRKLLNVL